jgi:hypothetical protein
MGYKMDYRQEGYQQGYNDAKITGGKVSKKYTDTIFNSKKNNLSSEEFREFINGWHDGIADCMAEFFKRMVREEGIATKYLSDLF